MTMDECHNSSLESPITQKRDIKICQLCKDFRRYDSIWFYRYLCRSFDLDAKKECDYKELPVPRRCTLKMEYNLKEWNDEEKDSRKE